jgi:hypothetical protein
MPDAPSLTARQVAEHGWRLLPQYRLDVTSGAWEHCSLAGRPLQHCYPACKLSLGSGASGPAAGPAAAGPLPLPCHEPAAQQEDSGLPLDPWGAASAAAREALQAFAAAQEGAAELLQQQVWRLASAALGRPAKLGCGERRALYRHQLQQAGELYAQAGAWRAEGPAALLEGRQQGSLYGSRAEMSASLQRHRWWLMPEEAEQLLASPSASSCTAGSSHPLLSSLRDLHARGGAKAAAAAGKATVVAEAILEEGGPSGPGTPLRESERCLASRGALPGPQEGEGLSGLQPPPAAAPAALLSVAALLEMQHVQCKQLLGRCWAGTVLLQGCSREGVRLTLLPVVAAKTELQGQGVSSVLFAN